MAIGDKHRDNDFILRVAGVEYRGWSSVFFRDDMDEIVNAFGVVTVDFFPGESDKWKLKMGDNYEAFINKTLVSTGFIEDINIFYTTDNHSMEIRGRSKTADLVDCSFEGSQNEWKKQSISNIIKNICSPFDIDVDVDDTASVQSAVIIDTFKANEGDYILDMIKRLCNENGIVPLVTPEGFINLTTATTSEFLNDKIVQSGNTMSIKSLIPSNSSST